MDNPGYMAFTETDPATLAFNPRHSATTGAAVVDSQIASAPNRAQASDGIGSNFITTGRADQSEGQVRNDALADAPPLSV
jgi:hypothetical protein